MLWKLINFYEISLTGRFAIAKYDSQVKLLKSNGSKKYRFKENKLENKHYKEFSSN